MSRLLGVTGKAYSGKDTFADYLVKHYEFEKIAFAEPLKAGMRAMFDSFPELFELENKDKINPILGRSYRYLAQTLGTEWGRVMVGPDVWVKIGMMRAMTLLEEGRSVVFSDVRFMNEAQHINEAGGIIYEVTNPNVPEIEKHCSESGIEPSLITRTLHNDGTLEDFYTIIDKLSENV